MEYLLKNSDEDHAVTTSQIIAYLNSYGIAAERKTVYSEIDALDMAVYARKTFGMFTGEEVNVHLRFENHLVGAVLDRLGRDVMLVPD